MGGGIIYLVVDIQKVQGRNRAVLGVSALWSYIRRPPYRDESAKCISTMEMVLTKKHRDCGVFFYSARFPTDIVIRRIPDATDFSLFILARIISPV